MSDNLVFNYKSSRSEKARISVKFTKVNLVILKVTAVVLVIIGLVLLTIGMGVGWTVIALAVVPAMTVEWYNGELHHMRAVDGAKTIDDALSADILGKISKSPTPYELATIISSVSGGHFLAVRFGVSARFLQDIASHNPDDMQPLWQAAWDLYKDTNSHNISAIIIATAIIKAHPNGEKLISHLQLGLDDLIAGVEWYNHVRLLVEKNKLPKKTGGFGRDWSFGYAPLLDKLGDNISSRVMRNGVLSAELEAHSDAISKMIDIFSHNGRQNAVLIGPDGIGKTQIVYSLAEALMTHKQSIPDSLRYSRIYLMDASSLLASVHGRGEIEGLLISIVNEAVRAKNVIICLDNAHLFLEDSIGAVDLTNVISSLVDSSNLRLIMTINDQKFLELTRRNPHVVGLMNKIVVSDVNKSEVFDVMQDKVLLIEYQNRVTFMYQAFVEAYTLSDKYVYDIAMPGKAVSLLEAAARYSEDGLVSSRSVQQAVEKTNGVKVSLATKSDEKNLLMNLEGLIHERMIGQEKAVRVVCDAIRRARSGIRNQTKPIGAFMFLGPTGVGKTELSKALADAYYGGQDKIIRIDMNEYALASDAKKLIADASDNSTSLTAQVIKHPFSVILLDEIEKAHDSVRSTLLQVLDEGVLRDANNREVNFRDCIIIATSNAGADRIREYVERGFDIDKSEQKIIEELIDSKQFRAEFVNRFDEIVVFKPLTKDELLKIVDIILSGINKTLSPQKITVNVDIDAKKFLVDEGYDPRLGARPMRRTVEKFIENTIAKKMLSGDIEAGGVVNLSLDQIQTVFDKKHEAEDLVHNQN